MTTRSLRIHVTNDALYMENGYTVSPSDSDVCWIIDPGFPPQAERIIHHVRRHSLQPAAIVLTHAHPDHIAGIDDVRATLGPLPVYLAKEEWTALKDPIANLSALIGQKLTTQVDDPKDLPPGAVLDLDGIVWDVLDTAGHSPGGRTLYSAELGIAFVGDALFAGSIGRIDFPHSDGQRLFRNLRDQLLTLPDETRVLSGHGPETTIGRERKTNPYLGELR